MKKVVSLFFALFVVLGSVFARNAKLDFATIRKGSATPSLSYQVDGVNFDFDCKSTNKRAAGGLNPNGRYLSIGDYGCPLNMDFTVPTGKSIISIKFVGNVTPLLKATISSDAFECSEPEDGVLVYNVKYANVNAVSITLATGLKFNMYVYSIEVEYGNIVSSVTLSDTKNFNITDPDTYASKITYKRSMTDYLWGSLCLPFDYTVTGDENFDLYYLSRSKSENYVFNRYNDGRVIEAGTVCFIRRHSNVSSVTITSNGKIKNEVFENGLTSHNWSTVDDVDYDFHGTVVNTSISNGFVFSKDCIYEVTKTVAVKPYRGWIVPKNATAAARLRNMSFEDIPVVESEAVTSVDEFFAPENEEEAVFNIQGAKIGELQKGLNIVKVGNSVKKIYKK